MTRVAVKMGKRWLILGHRWLGIGTGLFFAFHRLDLPVLIFHGPAWDAAQWCLNLLAATIAVTGLIGGWRRLRRAPRIGDHRRDG